MTGEGQPVAGGAWGAPPATSRPVARRGARVILKDRAGRLLLFEGVDPAVPEVRYWFTPGGGLEPGESYEDAARRELLEEASCRATDLGAAIREDVVEFGFRGVRFRQLQRYFAVELAGDGDGDVVEVGREGWTEDEIASVTAHRWWSLDEIETTSDAVYPGDLAELVRSTKRWGRAEPA